MHPIRNCMNFDISLLTVALLIVHIEVCAVYRYVRYICRFALSSMGKARGVPSASREQDAWRLHVREPGHGTADSAHVCRFGLCTSYVSLEQSIRLHGTGNRPPEACPAAQRLREGLFRLQKIYRELIRWREPQKRYVATYLRIP